MAARKPGIAKRGPRSSKVAPKEPFYADPDAVERLERFFRAHTKPALQVVQPPQSLRQRFANWLESQIIPRLRRA